MGKPDAIRPVADDDRRFVRFMLFGEPGIGKTRFAGTGERTLFLCNRPDETIAAAANGSKAEQWHTGDYEALTEAYEWLRHEGLRGPDAYRWVWLDNASIFQDQGLDQIMEAVVMARPHRSVFKPDKPEYGENQNRMSKLVRQFCDLPVNFGMTAHVMRMEGEDGEVVHMPAFQGGDGKFSQKLCGYMNVVGYMKIVSVDGKRRRRICLNKTGTYYAKDRYDSTEKGRLDFPTIPKFMEGVNKKFPDAGKPPPRPAKKSTTKKTATTRRA